MWKSLMFAALTFASATAADDEGERESVLVVGAGVAGLAAASRLSRSGYDVHIMEASDRVGGRMKA